MSRDLIFGYRFRKGYQYQDFDTSRFPFKAPLQPYLSIYAFVLIWYAVQLASMVVS